MAAKCESCDGKGYQIVTLCPGRVMGFICQHCNGGGIIYRSADEWMKHGVRPHGETPDHE